VPTASAVEDLFLVRHAESEGNVAAGQDPDHGRSSEYAKRVRQRPHWLWRLSPAGELQAAVTGVWLRDQLAACEGGLVAATSPHLRAMETAAKLRIPDAAWEVEPDLRERDWGDWDSRSAALQGHEIRRQQEYPFDWCPPGGESMSLLIRRVTAPLRRLLGASAVAAVVVTHADALWALRYVMADLSPTSWLELFRSECPTPNCGVIHFSRRHPQTGELSSRFAWYRRHCPWRESTAGAIVEVPHRLRFSAGQLLDEVNRVERIPCGARIQDFRA
jgi:broad specificity phosphatase PhoE